MEQIKKTKKEQKYCHIRDYFNSLKHIMGVEWERNMSVLLP